MYTEDGFQKPQPFAPDVVVPIDSALSKKVAAIDALGSQFYEWNPWLFGYLDEVPATAEGRMKWTEERAQRPLWLDRESVPRDAGGGAGRGAWQGGEDGRSFRALRVRHAAFARGDSKAVSGGGGSGEVSFGQAGLLMKLALEPEPPGVAEGFEGFFFV